MCMLSADFREYLAWPIHLMKGMSHRSLTEDEFGLVQLCSANAN